MKTSTQEYMDAPFYIYSQKLNFTELDAIYEDRKQIHCIDQILDGCGGNDCSTCGRMYSMPDNHEFERMLIATQIINKLEPSVFETAYMNRQHLEKPNDTNSIKLPDFDDDCHRQFTEELMLALFAEDQHKFSIFRRLILDEVDDEKEDLYLDTYYQIEDVKTLSMHQLRGHFFSEYFYGKKKTDWEFKISYKARKLLVPYHQGMSVVDFLTLNIAIAYRYWS
ncbi:TPA: hypothetical protein NJ353_004098 [Vibrio parahaemolyticus]|nr:hypothetical protein [Vibrio parahaemolyticus]HCG7083614.1 hypothetical protein [Vibrio parahaemolyticus]HCH0725460.1 hypothetical protein [Vibrio parahaemolyticus]HCH1053906.1 hypothetical protein [Vibrio parahaemolyticus]HCH5614475.1 hypothetical protein [Vibrio parahaemolyticus]